MTKRQEVDQLMRIKSKDTLKEIVGCKDSFVFSHIPVSELDFSVRTTNVLNNLRIDTVQKLLDKRFRDLQEARNAGFVSLNEIVNKLSQLVKNSESDSDRLNGFVNLLIEDISSYAKSLEYDEKLDLIDSLAFLLPDKSDNKNLVLNYLAKKKEEESVEFSRIRNTTIPDSLLHKNACSFVYAYDKNKIGTVIKHWLSDDITLEELNTYVFETKKDLFELNQWYLFVSWLNRNLNEELLSFFNSAISDRTFQIISKLASGEVLETVGTELGITRERVRQIKEKCISRIKRTPNIDDWIYWFSGLLGCPSLIRVVDIKEYFSDDIFKLVHFGLKNGVFDVANEWQYSARFDSILYCGNESKSEEDIEAVIRAFPDEIQKDKLDSFLLAAAEETNCPIGLFINEIDTQFINYGTFYSRKKYAVPEMFSIILRDFFPDGFQINSDSDTAILVEKLMTIFCYDASQMSKPMIASRVSENAILTDRGTYKHIDSFETSELTKNQIKEYIAREFSEKNRTAISFAEMFDNLKLVLDNTPIANQYMLHSLVNSLNLPYYTNNSYLLKTPTSTIDDDFVEFVKKNYPVSRARVIKHFCISSEAMLGAFISRNSQIYSKSNMLFYRR